jgi:hypothetical protein
MLLRNTQARLITINGKQDENGERVSAFKILPGKNPAVEVPDELCGSDFVKALIAAGALVVLAQPAPVVRVEIKPNYTSLDKTALQDLCDSQDLPYDLRDSKTTLIAKLDV